MGHDWEDVSIEVRTFGVHDFLNRGQREAVLVNAKNWIERNYYEWEGLQ